MYKDRIELYQKLEENRQSKVLVYITGDKPGMEVQIHPEVVSFFADHLDELYGKRNKISLILYSKGGITLAAWNIVNLIRMYFDEFEVIIPSVALSAATLISIGADKIIMTKQATLGPIDPSVNTPLGPKNQFGMSVPVSVEDVTGYFELAKKEMMRKPDLVGAFHKLIDNVHPLTLGAVSRSRKQIKMLAERLLEKHMDDQEQRRKIIDFLCSESGSHDYTINRREAEQLKLPIEKPDDSLYVLLKTIFEDIRKELTLQEPFNPTILLGSTSESVKYRFTRALIESIEGGSHQMQSEGEIINQPSNTQPFPGQLLPVNVPVVYDQRTKEGWFYEQPTNF